MADYKSDTACPVMLILVIPGSDPFPGFCYVYMQNCHDLNEPLFPQFGSCGTPLYHCVNRVCTPNSMSINTAPIPHLDAPATEKDTPTWRRKPNRYFEGKSIGIQNVDKDKTEGWGRGGYSVSYLRDVLVFTNDNDGKKPFALYQVKQKLGDSEVLLYFGIRLRGGSNTGLEEVLAEKLSYAKGDGGAEVSQQELKMDFDSKKFHLIGWRD